MITIEKDNRLKSPWREVDGSSRSNSIKWRSPRVHYHFLNSIQILNWRGSTPNISQQYSSIPGMKRNVRSEILCMCIWFLFLPGWFFVYAYFLASLSRAVTRSCTSSRHSKSVTMTISFLRSSAPCSSSPWSVHGSAKRPVGKKNYI